MTRTVNLEDVASEVTVGHVGSMKDEYRETGVPFLRSLNILPHRIDLDETKYISPEFHAKLKKSALKPDDVVIVRTGKPGTCAVVPKSLPVSNCSDLVIVRCGPELRPRFLAYWVNTIASEHVAAHIVGAVQQHFNVGAAKKMPIRLPTLEEQDEILGVLGALDDKIEANRKAAACLEEMARALYRSWFVNFDPVHAKSQNRPPAHMDAATAALFPDRFGDNGLPEGWSLEPIAKHFKATKGLSYKGSGLCQEGDGVPLHNLNSVLEGGGYKYAGIKYYSGDFKDRHMVRPGDLIVANTEQGFDHLLIGHAALVPQTFGPTGLFSHHLYKVEPKASSHLSREWLYLALSVAPLGIVIRSYSNGTTVNMLPADAFELPLVLVPPKPLADCMNALVTPWFSKRDAAIAENPTLAYLRDSLLPRLMSGELRVGEAREQVEEAV